MQGMAKGDDETYKKIEQMSCNELREFILSHGNLAIGFERAEKEFKYRPCD